VFRRNRIEKRTKPDHIKPVYVEEREEGGATSRTLRSRRDFLVVCITHKSHMHSIGCNVKMPRNLLPLVGVSIEARARATLGSA